MTSITAPPGKSLKSVQRGKTSIPQNTGVTITAAITTVDMTKSFVTTSCATGRWVDYSGYASGYGWQGSTGDVRTFLDTASAVGMDISGPSNYYTSTGSSLIAWEVIE